MWKEQDKMGRGKEMKKAPHAEKRQLSKLSTGSPDHISRPNG